MPTLQTNKDERVFPAVAMAQHMPFFDGSTLVFCQGPEPIEHTYPETGLIWKRMRHNQALAERFKDLPKANIRRFRPWKLAYCNWADKLIVPIKTGLTKLELECSPSMYRDNGKIYLSFIGGTWAGQRFHYRLYTTSGPDLDSLEVAEVVATGAVYFGFVSPFHIGWGIRNTLNLTEKASKKSFQLESTFRVIQRATFLAESPAKLLLTGTDESGHHRTVLHDLATKQTSDVVGEGQVYKSSISGDHLVQAKKRGEGLENWELHHGTYDLSTSVIRIVNK